MRSVEEVQRVLELGQSGMNASEIARVTGIPRPSVRDWLSGRLPRSYRERDLSHHAGRCPLRDDVLHPNYAYMLGMYLGDGCLSAHPRGVYRLRVALDGRYPELIFECAARARLLLPQNRVSLAPMSKGAGCYVSAYSQHLPCLFPQHGSGPKHLRRIALDEWQRGIVDSSPEMLLRGLLHSDGCRNMNNRGRGSRWQGLRYLFNNRSDDIRALFCDACDRLGIRWRNSDCYTISVARAADTARLDDFVGPKR